MIRKLYIVNSDKIGHNLSDTTYLTGLYFKSGKIMKLCDYIIQESNELLYRYEKSFKKYVKI